MLRRSRTFVAALPVAGVVLALSASATAGTHSNPATIAIPDNAAAQPYPSTIAVSGETGTVTDVNVTVTGLAHTWPDDVGLLLVGPGGQKVLLMTDVGDQGDVQGVSLTFDDEAAGPPPDNPGTLASGTYRPGLDGTVAANDCEAPAQFPAPAPGPPYATALSAFDGSAPNGTWSLYVFDDCGSDVGQFSGGWSLTISTQPVALADDPASEPPPQPPPDVAKILVDVSGNGTVTQTSSARGTASAFGQGIRCGIKGAACYSEVPPDGNVRLTAQAARGYSFRGWSGSCAGRGASCNVRLSASSNVGALFTPRGGARVTARLREPRVSVRWRESVGVGTLVVTGSTTVRARMKLQLRRPGGGPLLNRTFSVFGGPFQVRETLRRGRLLRGAALFPGGFTLSLRGRAGRIGVPLQIQTFVVPAPREGVVRRAYASTSSTGRPARPIPRGSRQAWAIFEFITQPALGPITVSWYQPGGRLIGTAQKSNRPVIRTGIGAVGSSIPPGTYRVDLAAGGRVVKRVRIRVA
jgi:subtilisin-like proprotein convertase family protein